MVNTTAKTFDKVPVPAVDTSHEHGHSGPLIDVDPIHVVAGVATAGTAALGGIALGTLLTEMLPVLAFGFFGKRDINEHQKDFEEIVKSILENQISN